MKYILLVIVFFSLIAASVFAVPPLLRHYLGVDQPVLTVVSGSMWPKLSRGDIVFITKADPADIKVGTVIVFHHEKGLAVHRVVRMDNWSITTKGDANVREDAPILYSAVEGRVLQIGDRLAKIPWVGHIALLGNPSAGTVEPGEAAEVDLWEQLLSIVLSPVGFIVFVVFPLVLLFWDIVADAIKGIMPMSVRKRRMRVRAKRLQGAWGEEKTRRALRI
jgi:signal peptidase I